MAFANLAAYTAAVQAPGQQISQSFLTNSNSNGLGTFESLWALSGGGGGLGGTVPTTAAVPARNVTGAIGQQNGGAGRLVTSSIEVSGFRPRGGAFSNLQATGTLILTDRLSHQGGLVANVTTTQTTNLPTAALTRYTSGVGVWAGLEFYTAPGSTTATVTVSYTNQDGTAGRTSPAMQIGGLSSGPPIPGKQSALGVIPLASGDTGVRSVESVTLAATTGTAGNFGVTLFKPLLFLPVGILDQYVGDVIRGTLGGGLPEILDEACLSWIEVGQSQSAPQAGYVVTTGFTEV